MKKSMQMPKFAVSFFIFYEFNTENEGNMNKQQSQT